MDSDEDAVDSYVTFGTALDPIEEDEIPRKKPYSLEEQVAVDKQGRRRFHGAFTGGFSAGFFNTVGSLEGWKPSSFRSSRSERGGGLSQKPEDFMDEEDMEEFGIAPKVIRATSDYRDHQGKKRGRGRPQGDGPIPGEPVLHALLQPVRDTIGVRLLKKMGWKPGQGVGPRVTMSQKKQAIRKRQKQRKKVYGCSLPDEEYGGLPDHKLESSDEENEDDEEILYAPDDIAPFVCMPKNDLFGIGYTGLDRRPILFQGKSEAQANPILNITDNKTKISISGQAFGVGAFEDEDEDIYSREDMSHYDFSLEEQLEKKSKVRNTRWSQGNEANYAGSPLEGFVLGRERPKMEYFPPPKLPPDFKPVHKVRQTRFEPTTNESCLDGKKKGLRRHDLTAADREAILSETPRAIDSTDVPQVEIKVEMDSDHKPSEESPKPSSNQTLSPDSVIPKGTTQFKPFAANPEKQRRYEQYLSLLKSNQKGRLSELQPLSMTEWERDRERIEFEQAAKLYKPLMGLMFDRFVSAMHPDVGDDGGNATIRFPKEEESEKNKAARMKMFGRLTREKMSWTPCSLLYKRFNVPDPGFSAEPEVKRKTSKFSVFDFMASSSHNLASYSEESQQERKEEKAKSEGADASEVHLQVEVVDEVREGRLEESPLSAREPRETDDLCVDDFPTNKIDLFKAIFLSSSESESEEENQTTKVDEKSVASIPESTKLPRTEDVSSAAQVNVERNTSPPRGVFANLDLDAINHRCSLQKNDKKVESSPDDEHGLTPNLADVDVDSGTYGPRLPDKLKANVTNRVEATAKQKVCSENSSSDEVEWVEKSSHKAKKSKHHKSHRKKSKKHKTKYKQKKIK